MRASCPGTAPTLGDLMSPTESSRPLVTVLIPARNEEHFIAECLDSVLGQSYDNLDIVVVDGASDDRTAEIVDDYAARDHRIRRVVNPARITPVSLNVGLAAARGELLVRIDAHSTVPANYVERAVQHLSSGDWGGVGGRKDAVGLTPAGRAIAAALASPFGVGNSTYHHGESVQNVDHIPFGCYPVALARELGGWDERFTSHQDFEFDFRVRAHGKQLLFDPALRIDWICRQSVKELWRQYFRYGVGKAKFVLLHPDGATLRQVAPPAMVLWLSVAVLLLPFRPLFGLLGVAPYAAVVAVGTAKTAPTLRAGERKYLPLSFAGIHLAQGFGFYRGVMKVLQGELRKPKTHSREDAS